MSHRPRRRLQIPILLPSVQMVLMNACCMTGVTKAAQSEEQWAHEECHPPSLLLDDCFNRHFLQAQHHSGLTPAGLAGLTAMSVRPSKCPA